MTAPDGEDLPPTLGRTLDVVTAVCERHGLTEAWRSKPDGWDRRWEHPSRAVEVWAEQGASLIAVTVVDRRTGSRWKAWGADLHTTVLSVLVAACLEDL